MVEVPLKFEGTAESQDFLVESNKGLPTTQCRDEKSAYQGEWTL